MCACLFKPVTTKNLRLLRKTLRIIYLKKISPKPKFYNNSRMSTGVSHVTQIAKEHICRSAIHCKIATILNLICNLYEEKKLSYFK